MKHEPYIAHVPVEVQCTELPVRSALIFAHFSQSGDVSFYTGLPNAEAFRALYEFVEPKARRMHYWKGKKLTKAEHASPRQTKMDHLRALTMEQELLLTMMRLKLDLLVHDLAFRFNVGEALISSVFFTWIKFLSNELSWLIMWPDQNIIKQNLPTMFRDYYPKCVVIIDCAEVFIQTPTSLDVAAVLVRVQTPLHNEISRRHYPKWSDIIRIGLLRRKGKRQIHRRRLWVYFKPKAGKSSNGRSWI